MKGEKVLRYATMYILIFATMTQLTESKLTLYLAWFFMSAAITMAIVLGGNHE